MLDHGNVINVVEVGDDVHLLICLHSIRDKEGQLDYIAIALPWNSCYEEVYCKDGVINGMMFIRDISSSTDKFIES